MRSRTFDDVAALLETAGVRCARGGFRDGEPDGGAFVAWVDDVESDGADLAPASLLSHTVTATLTTHWSVEADDAETAVELALEACGLPWGRTDRQWDDDTQVYATTYTVRYKTKG